MFWPKHTVAIGWSKWREENFEQVGWTAYDPDHSESLSPQRGPQPTLDILAAIAQRLNGSKDSYLEVPWL